MEPAGALRKHVSVVAEAGVLAYPDCPDTCWRPLSRPWRRWGWFEFRAVFCCLRRLSGQAVNRKTEKA
jgi:hypothetical protein